MKKIYVRWQLIAYDFLIFLATEFFLLYVYRGHEALSPKDAFIQGAISFVCIFSARFIGSIYQQIWRYGGVQCYIRLLVVDGIAFVINWVAQLLLPVTSVTFARLLSIACVYLLASLAIRMMYRYAYNCRNSSTVYGKFLGFLLRFFAGTEVELEINEDAKKIKVAIIGAGRVGVSLAEELIDAKNSPYAPRCFVDVRSDKVNRKILGLPVLLETEATFAYFKNHAIQEVIFALPNLPESDKQRLYNYYDTAGFKVKVYDYPFMQSSSSKRQLREFDVEELLFRNPIVIHDEKTTAYYRDKVILITGGGGSIGSELCRQLAKMQPKTIIILDIYENGAYDVQQELNILYKKQIDIKIEIASITNLRAMDKLFSTYHPDIVINAAAHKHVPLMEHNCTEAVENNVFGTKNLVELCEKYSVSRFMMVSTDKAVNPTNVMGATKRMCELIVKNASVKGNVKYSATRFGNVLGSAGSVIPLFKKQIANGGPITITDKRIIRYFMTIPEAAELVLESGAIAENGELFVLDMGEPVKILDLAENMIRLSGALGVEIIETGLRPGEKLYEELLVKTDELEKTENSLIFIEREDAISDDELEADLGALKRACETGDDDLVRKTLMQAIPTFKTPEEVNAKAENANEMKMAKVEATV